MTGDRSERCGVERLMREMVMDNLLKKYGAGKINDRMFERMQIQYEAQHRFIAWRLPTGAGPRPLKLLNGTISELARVRAVQFQW